VGAVDPDNDEEYVLAAVQGEKVAAAAMVTQLLHGPKTSEMDGYPIRI
jgi:hypothetical protein